MIELDEVRRVTVEVVAENPTAINPREAYGTGAMGNCLYTKRPGDSNPKAAEHCLGGEVLIRLDVALPPEGRSVHLIDTRGTDALPVFESSAINYLGYVQNAADAEVAIEPGSDTYRQRTWAEALEIANSRFANSPYSKG